MNFFKGFLNKKNNVTMCTYCGVGCKVEVDLKNKKVKGYKNYEVNKGAICLKGAELLNISNKNRLTKIKYRENIESNFKETENWDKILNLISQKIKQTDNEKIAFYSAGQVLVEDYYIANKLFKGFLSGASIDSNSRTCIASPSVALTKVFGVDYIPAQMNDVLHTDLLIIAGANPAHGHIVFFEKYIKPAIKKGKKAVVIDPFKSETAKYIEKYGGLYIQIYPGSDVEFFNAVAKELLNKNIINKNNILKNLNFSQKYFKQLEKIDIEEALKISKVEKEKFYKLVDLIAENKKMVTIWGMGINQSSEGVQKNLALLNLHLLLDRFGKKGSNPFPLTGQTNAVGGRDVGGLATMLGIHYGFNDKVGRKKIAKFWGVDEEKLPKKKLYTITEIIKKALKDEIEIFIIMHSDPVYSLPNRNLVEKALKNIPLVIEINTYENTFTSKFAHIRLPAKAWGEKNGTQVNMDRHISAHLKIIEGPKVAKEDWKILCEIAKKLGYEKEFNYKNSEEIYKEFQKLSKLSKNKHLNHYDVNYKKLKKHQAFVWGKDFFKDKKALTDNLKPNIYFPQKNNLSLDTSEEYPFNLISVRTKNHWNSTDKTRNSKKITSIENTKIIYMNKKDMKKLSLINEDLVNVISPFGKTTLKVMEYEIKEGVVALPSNEETINYLTPFIVDPDSFQPDYNKAPVKIIKVS